MFGFKRKIGRNGSVGIVKKFSCFNSGFSFFIFLNANFLFIFGHRNKIAAQRLTCFRLKFMFCSFCLNLRRSPLWAITISEKSTKHVRAVAKKRSNKKHFWGVWALHLVSNQFSASSDYMNRHLSAFHLIRIYIYFHSVDLICFHFVVYHGLRVWEPLIQRCWFRFFLFDMGITLGYL